MRKKRLLICLLGLSLIFSGSNAFGQFLFHKKHKRKQHIQKVDTLHAWDIDTLIRPIPLNRQLFVDRVHKALHLLDVKDGYADNKIHCKDSALAEKYTKIVFHQIPLIDIHIENLKKGTQVKIGYHRSLETMIRKLSAKPFTKENYPYFKHIASNFQNMMIAIEEGKIKDFVHHHANIYTVDNSQLLDNFPNEKAYAFKTFGVSHPKIMIKRLPEFADQKYADPIVAAAARVLPGVILNYATSTSYLSTVVRRNTNPLVQTIAKIASLSSDPLKALPFLGLIYNKKMTISQADQAAATPESYFKALVAAELANDSIGKDILDKEVNYRGLQLVRIVNSLHESPDKIRFASIMDYNAPELYFMIIGGQDEIYTSSFVFMSNRLINKLQESGDTFLMKLHFYHFRTWIRMCAGYNMLSPFFATMSDKSKNQLMSEFVANLEKGGPNDLEDAVDVADAFGSITDPELMNFLQKEVVKNYERCRNNEKGLIVYGLLSTIMENAKDSKTLTGKLSIIPPITYVPYKELVDSNKKDDAVVIQAFFYGDKDGHMSFKSFQTNFPASEWTKTETQYWVKYSYNGNHHIDVYANFPGDEKKNEDATAQEALEAYLQKEDINPTIIIHRGHSYHLQSSLKYLTPGVKIVMLGSCGGYHNLAHVLDKSPDANIISTKQTGSMRVNEPIIRELLQQLTQGENIDWIKSWEDLDKVFAHKSANVRDMFSDYVPPNKNLGAIFIKAYRKIRQETTEKTEASTN